MNSVIEVIGVNKNFKDHAVLKNINLTVNKGEILRYYRKKWIWKNSFIKMYLQNIFWKIVGEFAF